MQHRGGNQGLNGAMLTAQLCKNVTCPADCVFYHQHRVALTLLALHVSQRTQHQHQYIIVYLHVTCLTGHTTQAPWQLLSIPADVLNKPVVRTLLRLAHCHRSGIRHIAGLSANEAAACVCPMAPACCAVVNSDAVPSCSSRYIKTQVRVLASIACSLQF
jgi:hypothetical protein